MSGRPEKGNTGDGRRYGGLSGTDLVEVQHELHAQNGTGRRGEGQERAAVSGMRCGGFCCAEGVGLLANADRVLAQPACHYGHVEAEPRPRIGDRPVGGDLAVLRIG